MGLREILLAGLVPGALSGIGLILAVVALPRLANRVGEDNSGTRRGEARSRGRESRWLAPLLLAVCMPLGAHALAPIQELWPVSVTNRFPAVGLAAGFAGLLVALLPAFPGRRAAAAAIGTASGAFIAWTFLGALPASTTGAAERWGLIAGFAAFAGALALVYDALDAKLEGFRLPLLCGVLAALVPLGAATMFSNGMLAFGPLVAIAAAAVVVGLIEPRLRFGPPAFTMTLTLIGLIVFARWFGTDAPLYATLLLFAALAAPAAALLPLFRDRPKLRLAAAIAPAALLAGVQAGLAVPAVIEAISPSAAGDYGGYDP